MPMSGALRAGPEGDALRLLTASSDVSRGVAGISFGLRERDVDIVTSAWTRGRDGRPRSDRELERATGLKVTTAESVLDPSDEVLELVRRIASESDDKDGCVGVGWAGWLGVCKSGW